MHRFLIKRNSRLVSRVLYLAVSIIYLRCKSLYNSSGLPLGIGRANQHRRYTWPCNSRDVRQPQSPAVPVGSYPAFSPLPRMNGAVFLCYISCTLADAFPLGSTMPYVARTFLFSLRNSDRTACYFKLSLFHFHTTKIR